MLHKAWQRPESISKSNLRICYYLCVLFFLMPFYGGDYYSYQEIYDNINKGNIYNIGSIEDIYIYIGQHSFNSYTLFRLVIWGTALLLIFRTGKNLRLKPDLFLLLLTCCFITTLAYARVTLPMALIFYGATLITGKKVSKIVFGIILIIVSYYFHKSAMFGMAMIIIALFATKLGRWTFIAFMFAIPLFLSIVAYLLSDFFMTSFAQEYININSAQGYLTNENSKIGIGALLLAILQRGPYYYISLIFLLSVINKKYNEWPKNIKVLGASVFLITITASLFMFDFGLNTYTMYYRFLAYAAIPSLCFMCFLRTKKLYPRLLKLSYWSLTLAVLYNISYTLYLSFVQ